MATLKVQTSRPKGLLPDSSYQSIRPMSRSSSCLLHNSGDTKDISPTFLSVCFDASPLSFLLGTSLTCHLRFLSVTGYCTCGHGLFAILGVSTPCCDPQCLLTPCMVLPLNNGVKSQDLTSHNPCQPQALFAHHAG